MSHRIPRKVDVAGGPPEVKDNKNKASSSSSSSSEEVTSEEIQELKKKLEDEKLPADQVKAFVDIASKFKKGKTSEEKMEGFVSFT